jgi:hypothetical protein
MEWTDLTNVSKNIIEQCWGLYSDDPRSFSVKFGQKLYKEPVTMEHYQEVANYQKEHPRFDVKLLEDGIYVRGNCRFNSND